MQTVPLAVVANQTFTIRLDNHRYKISIKEINGAMSATIVRDGITIISNVRCLPNQPLLPYNSLEDGFGNFIFITLGDLTPYWSEFNTSQTLYYLTNAEMVELRG